MESNTLDHNLPKALIVSSSNEKAEELVKNICEKYPLMQRNLNNYVLNIDNKYYTAQILFCLSDNLLINPADYEALIFYYDFKDDELLNYLNNKVLPFVSQLDVEILLLVSDCITDSSIKGNVLQWCATQKFELIELNSLDSKELLDFESNQTKYGIHRIIESLEAHVWPNIKLKGTSKVEINLQNEASNTEEKLTNLLSEVTSVQEQLQNVDINNIQDYSERLQMESLLDGIMNNEEADFGELFSNLRTMKENASSMPVNQRRVVAEQLVTAFWKAIGGDPSEIEDIEGSSK